MFSASLYYMVIPSGLPSLNLLHVDPARNLVSTQIPVHCACNELKSPSMLVALPISLSLYMSLLILTTEYLHFILQMSREGVVFNSQNQE